MNEAMNNDDKPITSRRDRRRAAAGDGLAELTPAQARAEAEAKAEAEATGAADGGPGAESGVQAAESTETGRIRSRRALDAPVDAVRDAEAARAERSSLARARDREALRVMRELAEKERAAQPPSRRSLRQPAAEPEAAQEKPQAPTWPSARPTPAARSHGSSGGDLPAGALPIVPTPAPAAEPAEGAQGEEPPSSGPAAGRRRGRQAPVRQAPDGSAVLGPETGSFSMLSHEQIAAAREQLREEAKAPAPAKQGRPDAVDPETLKQQLAQAERAAILNRRAQTRQRLAEASRRDAESGKAGPAPTAANNLAMVTPLEYVKVPGLPHPVMRPPTTTHVPVTTGKVREAAPVSAATAHGLEPLGVQAPQGNRERAFLLAFGLFGLVALIAAVVIVVLFGKLPGQ